jgi:hypothetical protein
MKFAPDRCECSFLCQCPERRDMSDINSEKQAKIIGTWSMGFATDEIPQPEPLVPSLT